MKLACALVFFAFLPFSSAGKFKSLLSFASQSHFRTTVVSICDLEDARDILEASREILGQERDLKVLNLQEDFENSLRSLSEHLAGVNVWIDLGCQESEDLLASLSSNRLLNGSKSFVFYGETFNESARILQGQNINVDTLAFLVARDTGRVYHVHSIESRRGTPIEIDEIGQISGTGDTNFRKPDTRLSKIDLQGQTLFVAFTVPKTPKGVVLMQYMKDQIHGHTDNSNRLGNNAVMVLGEMFNFRIHWVRSTSWGFKDENNNWTGSIQLLSRGDANFSSCPLLYLTFRHSAVDPCFGSIPLRQVFLFRHPKSGPGVSQLTNPFIRPISHGAWIAILVTTLITIALLCLINLYKEESAQLVLVVVTVIGMLAQQGVIHGFRSFYLRLVALMFLVMAFCIFQFYGASIVGSLLAPIPKTITSVQKLSRTNLKVVMEDLPSSIPVLHIGGGGIYEAKVRGQERFVTLEEGVRYVKRGGYAFLGYVDPGYDIIRRTFTADEMDDLQEVSVIPDNPLYTLHFMAAKGSPYKEMLRHGVLRLRESGILSYWRRIWMPPPPKGNIEANRAVVVDFERVQSLIFMLLWSYLASFLIFVGEVAFHQYKRGRYYDPRGRRLAWKE